MKPLFRYTFQAKNDYYYYVDNLGAVQLSLQPKYLTDDPQGSEKTQVTFDRKLESGGVFRSSSLALGFHSDAAKILRYIYYNDYFNGYCKFTVEKQNRDFASNNWLYATWFISEVDFGQSNDGDMELPPGDVFFKVRLMELGLPAVIDNHKDDTYEIPIYLIWTPIKLVDPIALQIEVGEITINNRYTWMIPETLDVNGNATSYLDIGGDLDTFYSSEDAIFSVGQATSRSHAISVLPGAIQDPIFKVTHSFDGHLNINFEAQYSTSVSSVNTALFQVRLLFWDVAGNLSTTLLYSDPGGPIGPGAQLRNLSVNATHTQTFSEGESFAIGVNFSSGGEDVQWRIQNGGGEFNMIADYDMPSSRMYGFTYKNLLQKILNKMAGGAGYVVQSSLLDDDFTDYFTRPSKNIVVPAASIRQLDDPKIKTSFTELMADLRTMFGVGWGIEGNVLRVEKMAYFYNKNINLLSITANTTVQKSTANDFIYNRIKIGFKDSSVDEINGLQEFCCEQEYNCGLTAPTIGSKELPLVSPYIHGVYSIENIRSYLFRSDTTSTPTDNETCVIEVNVEAGGIFFPAKTGFNGTTFTTGVKYPADIYNTGHSPKACLIRNLDYIKSFLIDGQIINFNTASKNANLEYGDASITVNERSNLEITTNGAMMPGTLNLYPNISRIFLPFIFQYTGEVPEHLLALMETPDSGTYKKYGTITIYDGDAELEMFALDIGVTPATDDAYQIRGLCSPNTNLQNLIR